MKSYFDKKKNRVLYILENFAESRNSDKALIKFYIATFHPQILVETPSKGFAVPLEDYHLVDNTYNFVRMRQKCQEEGRFLPTSWEVAKKRKLNEVEWRTYMIKENMKKNIDI